MEIFKQTITTKNITSNFQKTESIHTSGEMQHLS